MEDYKEEGYSFAASLIGGALKKVKEKEQKKIFLPVCIDCEKPLVGRKNPEERCWCDTVGNWAYKEMDPEEE